MDTLLLALLALCAAAALLFTAMLFRRAAPGRDAWFAAAGVVVAGWVGLLVSAPSGGAAAVSIAVAGFALACGGALLLLGVLRWLLPRRH